MEERILEIMRIVFETNDVNVNSTQENCSAWDSMAQLNLALELEEEFGISLEPEEISKMKSFDEIKNIVEKNLRHD